MQPVTSGTSNERIARTLIPLLLANGFAAAFLWDGHVGYARQNAEKLIASLGLDPDAVPTFSKELTASDAKELAESIQRSSPLSAVTDRLGTPSLEHGDDVYFLGPAGHLVVRRAANRVESAQWLDAPKNEFDLALQRWIGYILAPIGLVLILQLVRVLTARTVLDDAGLTLPGRPPIPLDEMTQLTREDDKSDVLVMTHTPQGSQSSVNLDPYQIKHLDAIVDTICEQKSWPNPLSP